MTQPALLGISHGTGSPAGQAAVTALIDAVDVALPGVTVRLGHVDVQQPDVPASLAALPVDQPVTLVPLLLSAGYHVHVDLVEQTQEHAHVAVSPALGPDERLVTVLAARLRELGLRDDDTVVLAVAGSSDDRANDDCRAVAALLAEHLGRPVAVGFLAAAEPRLADAVQKARADASARVVVANYLLAPGYFSDLAATLSAPSPVARPLLDADPPAAELVALVVDRYRQASDGL